MSEAKSRINTPSMSVADSVQDMAPSSLRSRKDREITSERGS